MKPVLHDVDADGDIVIVLREPNEQCVTPKVRRIYKNKVTSEYYDVPDETKMDTPKMPSGLPEVDPSAEASLEVRFRVSSHHLKSASPVFKAMLDGPWRENSIKYTSKNLGTQATPDDFTPIPLPSGTPSPTDIEATTPQDDSASTSQDGEVEALKFNAYALLVILKVIHNDYSEVPLDVSWDFISHVTVIADYYQCTEAVSFLAKVWLHGNSRVPKNYGNEAIVCLFVACKFSLQDVFQDMKRLVVQSGQGREHVDTFDLPIHGILKTLDKKRQTWFSRIIGKLNTVNKSLVPGVKTCTFNCQAMMYGAMALERNKADYVAGDKSTTLSEIFAMIDKFEPITWRDPRSTHHQHQQCIPKWQLQRVIDAIRSEMNQLKVSDFEKL